MASKYRIREIAADFGVAGKDIMKILTRTITINQHYRNFNLLKLLIECIRKHSYYNHTIQVTLYNQTHI